MRRSRRHIIAGLTAGTLLALPLGVLGSVQESSERERAESKTQAVTEVSRNPIFVPHIVRVCFFNLQNVL